MRQKTEVFLSIDEAMENLATIVSIHLDSPPPIGIIQGKRLVLNPEEIDPNEMAWLESEGTDQIFDLLDLTYKSVEHHLKELSENSSIDLEERKTRQGIAAMMSLVGEAAKKMDGYLEYRLEKEAPPRVELRRSYKNLQKYYLKQFASLIEGKDAWNEEVEEYPQQKNVHDLKNFDAILRDRDYELFFIVDQEGNPFLSENLLRNLKLTSDFDLNTADFENDPFLKIRSIQDRNYRASSSQILHLCESEIAAFYKQGKELFKHPLAKILSQSILALYLAANPKFLLQRSIGKICTKYFEDFQMFLRDALQSADYQKWAVYPPSKSDKEAYLLLNLAHKLCFGLFSRAEGVKQEAIGIVHRAIRRGEELHSYFAPEDTLWNRLLLDDEKLRALFLKYPNGPIFKTLDQVRLAEEEGGVASFNPSSQGNLPCQIFNIEKGTKKVSILHLPTPTCQTFIHRAEVNDEFRGYLRYRASTPKIGRHLLVNLQDRLSWKEMARSTRLEQLREEGLVVLTLPKDTDFYHQRGEYAERDGVSAFVKDLKEQLSDPEANGYFFPKEWKQTEVMEFAEKMLKQIHEMVFDGAKKLGRKEREDFIEIFYLMFTLWAVDISGVGSVSFTCKDGIDAGAFSSALLYGVIRLMRGELEGRENIDFLRYLFYWPALSLRERAVDPEGFHRALSAMERFGNALKRKGKSAVKAFDMGYTIS